MYVITPLTPKIPQCPHRVLKLSVVTVISLIIVSKIHRFVFRMEACCVLCEVWNKYLYIMLTNFCLQGIARLYCPMITCFCLSALWNGWVFRRFGGTYYLYLQGQWNDYFWTNSVTLKNWGSKFLCYSGTCKHWTGQKTKEVHPLIDSYDENWKNLTYFYYLLTYLLRS